MLIRKRTELIRGFSWTHLTIQLHYNCYHSNLDSFKFQHIVSPNPFKFFSINRYCSVIQCMIIVKLSIRLRLCISISLHTCRIMWKFLLLFALCWYLVNFEVLDHQNKKNSLKRKTFLLVMVWFILLVADQMTKEKIFSFDGLTWHLRSEVKRNFMHT